LFRAPFLPRVTVVAVVLVRLGGLVDDRRLGGEQHPV
jgi:hypothetical protein